MIFIVVLISLAVQRLANIDSYTRQFNWFTPYYCWLRSHLSRGSAWSGYAGVVMVLLPILLITSLVVALIYLLAGKTGYFVLSLLLLWYFLDARRLQEQMASAQDILKAAFVRIFSIIFWYIVLGPFGIVLAAGVKFLRLQVLRVEPEQEDNKKLQPAVLQLQGIIDWVPVRLLGLSYALVGHFAPIFSLWTQNLLTGARKSTHLAADFGMAALQLESVPAEVKEAQDDQLAKADALVDHAILVWLVVLAIFSIGMWLG